MLIFRCPDCDKDLKATDTLAGKQSKCPGCGKSVTVPHSDAATQASGAKAAARSRADGQEVHVAAALPAEERTLPPANPGDAGHESICDADGQTSLGGGAKGESTQAGEAAGFGRELTDFLSPPQQPDEIGRLGPFRVLKVLGAGGMGVVYKAEDPQLKRPVALKAMLPTLGASESARKRFLREARVAAAIVHDHIVSIHQVGEDRGIPFVAMQYLQGESLDERLKREPLLPITEVLRIGREVAEGLAAAHAKELIHRDIKPANIWLENRGEPRTSATGGRVKILDFGLARATSDDSHLTQTGAIVGTPAFMAPEQAAGETVDPRCDLFSLGCVLYRLSTGTMPFKGKDSISTLIAVATEKPAPPAEMNSRVPPELSDLVMQLLAKKPNERPPSAQSVVKLLQELELRPSGAATRSERPKSKARPGDDQTQTDHVRTPPRLSAKKRQPWLVGGGALGLGLVALLVLLLSDKGERERVDRVPAGKDVVKKAPAEKKPELGVELPPKFTNTIGMDFVLVPKGKSWLGGGGGKMGDGEVEFKDDFYLGIFEVTHEEWEKVMDKNPSHFSRIGSGKDAVKDVSDADLKRFPVESVSGGDVQLFITRLNEREKNPVWAYGLPGRDQWEYACRGGPSQFRAETQFDFYLENPTAALQANQANFKHAENPSRPCKVGSFSPNRLGLYDMHGNIGEWCAEQAIWQDDQGRAGARQLWRGGSWRHSAEECNAKSAGQSEPWVRRNFIGLRLARYPLIDSSKRFTNALGMEFLLVPKGKAWLGGGGGKPGAKEVDIANDYYLGKYEVTQEEWQKVMGDNPSHFCRNGKEKDAVKDVSDDELRRFPVDHVSWTECQEFVIRLNEKLKEPGWRYRLPTQVEWEYACRGGPSPLKEDFGFDYYLDRPTNTLLTDRANFKGVRKLPCKVGSYPPNKLGFHDMHGNVSEWCDDALIDEKGITRRVFRGGGFRHTPGYCRAVFVIRGMAWHHFDDLGLRLARVPAAKEPVAPAVSRTVDLLKLVDVKRDAVKGDWSIGAEGLASDAAIPFCRLKLPYRPPAEYDFRIEFTAKGNNDILQILAAGDKSFTWLMGGYAKWDVFDIVKGHGFNREGVNIIGGPSSIKPGQRHTSVVEIRKGSIVAKIDGKVVVEHKTDFSDVGIPDGWQIGSGILGLGTTFNAAVFHKIEVLEISGSGTVTAEPRVPAEK